MMIHVNDADPEWFKMRSNVNWGWRIRKDFMWRFEF